MHLKVHEKKVKVMRSWNIPNKVATVLFILKWVSKETSPKSMNILRFQSLLAGVCLVNLCNCVTRMIMECRYVKGLVFSSLGF